MAVALGVAIIADLIQLGLGPWGWVGLDQVIDLVAMLVISFTIGFHPLFLPTFVAEFIPGIDLLPSWAGCVLFVLIRQWKAQQQQFNAPPVRSQSGVIDV